MCGLADGDKAQGLVRVKLGCESAMPARRPQVCLDRVIPSQTSKVKVTCNRVQAATGGAGELSRPLVIRVSPLSAPLLLCSLCRALLPFGFMSLELILSL